MPGASSASAWAVPFPVAADPELPETVQHLLAASAGKLPPPAGQLPRLRRRAQESGVPASSPGHSFTHLPWDVWRAARLNRDRYVRYQDLSLPSAWNLWNCARIAMVAIRDAPADIAKPDARPEFWLSRDHWRRSLESSRRSLLWKRSAGPNKHSPCCAPPRPRSSSRLFSSTVAAPFSGSRATW